ncbi:leukotriene B4 receptor 1-like [Ambystoma mexicanum]|uniref:leukotriene B4 receptor 1-like n=1 Tax=Ambystoma mexicanum TaxID=8296 RepID=UPI0037E92EFE
MNHCVRSFDNETLVTSSVSSISGTVVLLLAALIGIPGNVFIIWSVLWRMKGKDKSVTCILILNLAMADGTVLCMTPFFIAFLIMRTWIFKWAVCKVVYYITCVNMYASIHIITLMSLDRLLAVTRPYLVQSIRKKHIARKVLMGIWTAAILLSIPAFAYREVVEEARTEMLICEPCHPTTSHTIFHYSLETIVAFLVPLIIILSSYTVILRRLKASKFRRRVRTEKLILAIVLTFTVLWLPYHVVNAVQVASRLATGQLADKLKHAWKMSRALASTLAFISFSINPVLYAFAASNFIKLFGMNFIVKLLEGTTGEMNRRTKSQRDLEKDFVNEASKGGESMEFNRDDRIDAIPAIKLPPV